jgi:hypothetical protein
MGGDLQDILLVRGLRDAQVGVDVECARCGSVLDDGLKAFRGGSCAVSDCICCSFNIVVYTWYIIQRAVGGDKERNV